MIKYFTVFLLVMSSLSLCFAQKDSVIVKEGKQYKVVQIQAKQTLYRLSKEYSVSTDEIKAANEGLPDGLKTGGYVLIPTGVVVSKVELKKEAAKSTEDSKVDDNLKIIRDFYKAPDSIKRLPPGICPVPTLMDNEKLKDPSYLKVAFILPFQLALVDTLENQKKDFQDFQIPLEVQVFADFYEGALIALDSLKQRGFKILVSVYDDEADSNVVKQILNRPEINYMNLIIGPAYSSCVKMAAPICAQKKIYMVSAFSKSSDLIDENPYVIKTLPSRKSFLTAIAEHAMKDYAESNFVLLGENENSKNNCEIISGVFSEKGAKATTVKVNASKLAISVDELKASLSKEKTNVIIMPTENEAFITRFINSVYKLSTDYKIVVYGMENWKDFSGVDIQQLQALNTHLPAANLERFDSPLNDKMIHAYARRFGTEPSGFAFSGYDITNIFITSLKQNKDFGNDDFLNRKWNGMMTDYYFVRKNPLSGIENIKVGMMVFNNYQLVWLNE